MAPSTTPLKTPMHRTPVNKNNKLAKEIIKLSKTTANY